MRRTPCVFSMGFCRASLAPDGDPEDFKIELTGSAWMVNASGQLQITGTSFDLVRDLAMEQVDPMFYGKLSKTESVGVPLAGTEFRIFPIPHHPIVEINGGVRGMGFGSYGHYVQGEGSGGINSGHVAIEAGYRAVVADIHNTSQTPSGVFAHLHGTIYSVVFRH